MGRDRELEAVEDLLWNLIPEAGHLRDQVGRIDIANGAKSHPLALTQLLVGYHAVKAAMGVRVSEAEEAEGLDIGEHAMEAYPHFQGVRS